ncbi:MAG: hypothetical protein GX555_19575 [Actinomycetales bacterium]|nr:hypothetical protein [Actinomycetales bacterium]
MTDSAPHDRASFGELVRNLLTWRPAEAEQLTPEQQREREQRQRATETLTYCVKPDSGPHGR